MDISSAENFNFRMQGRYDMTRKDSLFSILAADVKS